MLVVYLFRVRTPRVHLDRMITRYGMDSIPIVQMFDSSKLVLTPWRHSTIVESEDVIESIFLNES